MIAFTKEQGPKIFESVDMVNVMTYDLMNRRDNATAHHTSMQGSLDVVNEYMDMGLHADKINLGFAYYAKWFTTDPDSDCDKHPLGCKVVKLEEDDGSDNGKSGALTFEASTVADPPKDLKETTNGKCGYAEGTKCPKGQCCSAYGNWYVQHSPNNPISCREILMRGQWLRRHFLPSRLPLRLRHLQGPINNRLMAQRAEKRHVGQEGRRAVLLGRRQQHLLDLGHAGDDCA